MERQHIINHDLVKSWSIWALVWLTLFPLVGALVSIKFHHPDFLGDHPWMTFGRLRPVHVNGVIFGAFSTSFIALVYYLVPRLCGIPIYREEWGKGLLWLWNIFLVAGSVSLLLGYNLGLEAAEFEWPMNLLRFVVFGCLAIQVLGTIFRRLEPRLYVSLWYVTAALVWTLFNLILGNVMLPYGDITGTNSAAMHGLYIHYIVGLWLTPAGLAVIYYFLPLSLKQPLFSHKLSLLGFWSLAFFYPFVGTHHYLFSPIPYWTQTVSIVMSLMLIIPVWTVTVNFFGTAKGSWGRFLGGGNAEDYAAKFLMLGAVYYLLGCFQGSVEALRRMQELTHFNDFVIAHSHLTVFGSMVAWVVGGLYYIWPRVTGRQLWSARLASWHLWLTIVGFTIMAVGLTAQGFIQGTMLEHGVDFVSSVESMKPWWVARTMGGLAMDVAIGLMVLNFYQTARKGTAWSDARSHAQAAGAFVPLKPAKRSSWLEAPSTIILAGGIGFFFLAVGTQGIIPLAMAETRVTQVRETVTDMLIEVSTYSNEERQGRQVYIREGCWYCHSQYIRPVTGEAFRWGPVSQVGEYAYDRPHLFSTRRIGPDLTRIGRKYGDDWHVAHHWDPRAVVPQSIMPRFPWLFDRDGGDGPPVLNGDGRALIAYLQRLGTSIGDWREGFVSTRLAQGIPAVSGPANTVGVRETGHKIYRRHCQGCHGVRGDGQGPSAVFLEPKPRDFTKGIFKFHSTPGRDALPTDSDLLATISHGLWGTAMPPWYSLTEQERTAVIQYIKTFSERWKEEEVGEPIPVPPEPPITRSALEEGEKLFQACVVCHGKEGKGDGPLAGQVNDVWGHPIQPANFHLSAGLEGGVKLGHDSRHIFITIMTGVGGDPMPAFQEQFTPEEVWKVTHYVQSLRIRSQEKALLASGLEPSRLPEIRTRLWANLSGAAAAGDIAQNVLNEELPPAL